MDVRLLWIIIDFFRNSLCFLLRACLLDFISSENIIRNYPFIARTFSLIVFLEKKFGILARAQQ